MLVPPGADTPVSWGGCFRIHTLGSSQAPSAAQCLRTLASWDDPVKTIGSTYVPELGDLIGAHRVGTTNPDDLMLV